MGCVAVKTVVLIIPFKVAMLINNIISFNDIILYVLHRYKLSKALSSTICYQRYLHVSIIWYHTWNHTWITYNNNLITVQFTMYHRSADFPFWISSMRCQNINTSGLHWAVIKGLLYYGQNCIKKNAKIGRSPYAPPPPFTINMAIGFIVLYVQIFTGKCWK